MLLYFVKYQLLDNAQKGDKTNFYKPECLEASRTVPHTEPLKALTSALQLVPAGLASRARGGAGKRGRGERRLGHWEDALAEGAGRRKVCFGGRELQAARRRAGGIKPEREFQKERTLSLFLFPPSFRARRRGGSMPTSPHLRAEL